MCIFVKMKAELFDITTAKSEQQQSEMLLSPEERLLLCLDLTDLSAAISKHDMAYEKDDIKWIELSLTRKS